MKRIIEILFVCTFLIFCFSTSGIAGKVSSTNSLLNETPEQTKARQEKQRLARERITKEFQESGYIDYERNQELAEEADIKSQRRKKTTEMPTINMCKKEINSRLRVAENSPNVQNVKYRFNKSVKIYYTDGNIILTKCSGKTLTVEFVNY